MDDLLIDSLTRATRCRRCECPSCDRGGAGELHDHVCNGQSGCVDTVQNLRRALSRRNILCSRAAEEIRRLGTALADAVEGERR